MDKRYFFIIIIIFMGCINLFLVASNSDVIGCASVNFDGYTFSLPSGVNVLNTYEKYVQLSDEHLNCYISVSVNDNPYNTFESNLNKLNNSSEYKVLSKGIIDVGNIPVSSIYYQSSDSSKNISNKAMFFFEKDNTQFEIKLSSFSYSDRDKTIDVVSYIVESLRLNYK